MRRHTKYIVVHCSATPPDSDIGVDEIDDWHRRRGFKKIGYAAVIRRDGLLEFGRHFNAVGAHVKGQNYQSVGVCMVGGVDQAGQPADNFAAVQYDTLRVLLQMLLLAYPGAGIVGHRDLSPDVNGDGIIDETDWLKLCPSFSVAARIDQWNS